ncbi:MAG: celA [Anaerocolumna sp.]|jgi:endoglucanase|nr:celA [Anaerocolumna sp.]
MTYNKNIHINQVGYTKNDNKIAVLANVSGHFKIINVKNNQCVFEGDSKTCKNKGTSQNESCIDEASGDVVSYCDFSSVSEAGEYYIELEGQGRSYTFLIDNGIYTSVKNALLKGLYYQRCGVELEEKYAGPWAHAICHTNQAKIYNNPEKTIEVSGGWHDAGDYGRYATAGAVSVADILLSYELFGDVYTDDIQIPESGNGIPDALDEARVELEWLLKVQDNETGGVYHKVTTKYFCGMIMPEDEHDDLYALPESAVAAGDFAAVMAMAYRIYKKYDETFANTMLAAAKKAWEWLEKNPNIPGFKNPQDVSTGEYGDPNSEDERLWAATELYRVTGDDKYHLYIKEILKTDVDIVSFGWGSIGGYASFSYLRMAEQKEQVFDDEIVNVLKKAFLNKADELVSIANNDGYMADVLPKQYRWGSTMTITNGAQLLILSYYLTGNKEYEEVAIDQLHYILGRNPMGISYITGIGSNVVNNVHHRPSDADGVEKAVPGLISGGPNWSLNDEAAKSFIKEGTPAAKCFVDHVGSYSTNEIAIYWNTPALFVAAYADYRNSRN